MISVEKAHVHAQRVRIQQETDLSTLHHAQTRPVDDACDELVADFSRKLAISPMVSNVVCALSILAAIVVTINVGGELEFLASKHLWRPSM